MSFVFTEIQKPVEGKHGIRTGQPMEELSAGYVTASHRKSSALAVAPTHVSSRIASLNRLALGNSLAHAIMA